MLHISTCVTLCIMSEKPVQVKLVLLGEAAVGKSSLVLRFVNDEYQGMPRLVVSLNNDKVFLSMIII